MFIVGIAERSKLRLLRRQIGPVTLAKQGLNFRLFSFFADKLTEFKTVNFSGIQTRMVEVKGNNTDHSTKGSLTQIGLYLRIAKRKLIKRGRVFYILKFCQKCCKFYTKVRQIW